VVWSVFNDAVAGIEPATALSAAQEELIMKCTRECRFKDVVNFDCCNCCDVENCVGRCEDNYNTCEDKNMANICEEICPVNAGVCSPLGCDMIKTEVNKILRQFETLADEMIKSNDGIESQSGLRLSNLIEKIENSNGLS
jgi:hypothetical protein